MLKQINLVERFGPRIGPIDCVDFELHLNASPFFTAAGFYSARVDSLHNREVITQIMDFLQQREASSDLYVLGPSRLCFVPHDIPSEFIVLSEPTFFFFNKVLNDWSPSEKNRQNEKWA